jgi:DNA-binding response OmpR family regulator
VPPALLFADVEEDRGAGFMSEIHLTKKEAQIMDLLERNAGELVSKKVLLEHIGYREGVRTRTLDVHISRLRNKLVHRPSVRILTVTGLGYLMEPSAQLPELPAS